MKYTFLTTLIPKELEKIINENSRNNMQDAASALQWNIYRGLKENVSESITICNILPIGSYPQYYKKAFIKTTLFSDNIEKHKNIAFCNIKLIRKKSIENNVYKTLKKKIGTEEEWLFVYTLSASFLRAIYKLKRKKTNLKVCAIVADLPNMADLSNKKSLLKRFYQKITANNCYKYMFCVDAFVLLTAQMAEYMKIDKPFCVMEGIATKPEMDEPPTYKTEKTIFYSGTLHKRFGIDVLLEAFSLISDKDYRLILCGIGDSEEKIKDMAKVDSRICFLGKIPREEVLQKQKQATVLVNPRQNKEAFTKYSFPSKTMEYLASGIPVVAYKLDGIPTEYDNYIQYVFEDTPHALANKLMEICESSVDLRKEIGMKAQQFIYNEKNAQKQAKKIIDLIKLVDEL